MRRSTAIMAMYEPDTQTGENLQFELCKGGYFSDREEYGLKVVGKTHQETLTGKNLVDYTSLFTGKGYEQSSYINLGNGLYKCTKSNYQDSARLDAIFLPKGKYTLSVLIEETTLGVSCVVRNMSSELSAIPQPPQNVEGKTTSIIKNNTWTDTTLPKTPCVIAMTFDITESHTGYVAFQVQPIQRSDLTYPEYITFRDLQLELGSAATSYEPYCGGIPAPNPDYPMPIQCVKAGTRVQVCGKNLFDNRFSSYRKPKDYHICDVALSPGKYYFGCKQKGETVKNITVAVVLFGEEYKEFSKAIHVLINTSGNIFPTVLTVDDTWTSPKLAVYCSGEDAFNAIFENYEIQFEPGTEPTEFEPYISSGELVTPCDLYEGDIWWPMTGKVERHTGIFALTASNFDTIPSLFAEAYTEFTVNDLNAAPGFLLNPGDAYCNVFECHYTESGTRGNYFMIYGGKNIRFPSTFNRNVLNDIINNHGDITFYYPIAEEIIENYDPQTIFAPAGTVNVLQSPAELPGELSATMLVKGGNQ